MLKITDSMKHLQARANNFLRELLAQVSIIDIQSVEPESIPEMHGFDITRVTVSGCPWTLVCSVMASGQPRHVRTALLQLRNHIAHQGSNVIPILIAPYLSPEAQTMCREQLVGHLDLEGNVRITFGGIFIERLVANKPAVERRELKSLFKPKSALVLRMMLRDPSRAWRVAELADVTGVSLGHISNVRAGLLDREWAQISNNGLFLSEPDALLDAWRNVYESPLGKRMCFYTPLHGSALETAAREGVKMSEGRAVFASFSAANWLAPYGRVGTQYFYANDEGVKTLQTSLQLSPVSKGENIVVIVPKDDGVFKDTIEPAHDAICTSLVQTYLDLINTGERGEEAAQHLRQEKLTWIK